MGQANKARAIRVAVCAASLAVPCLWTEGGQAETRDGVTTVSPLIVSPLAPVPNVGAGATYFTPQELTATAHQAREDHIDARDAAVQCGAAGYLATSEEDLGLFTLPGLFQTERDAQRKLQDAALAAETATQAAIDARAAAGRGEDEPGALIETELARQTTVKALQAAQAAVAEARFRIADLEDQIDLSDGAASTGGGRSANQNLTRLGIRAYVDEQSRRRKENGGLGGIFVPEEFKDLRMTDIVSRQGDDKGVAVIRISGRIFNPRLRPITVPPIWVSAVDRFGTPLKIDQAEPPPNISKINPRTDVAFTYELKPMPDKTARTVITFAPLHHVPEYKPATEVCL